jgi:hypothetical protein
MDVDPSGHWRGNDAQDRLGSGQGNQQRHRYEDGAAQRFAAGGLSIALPFPPTLSVLLEEFRDVTPCLLAGSGELKHPAASYGKTARLYSNT